MKIVNYIVSIVVLGFYTTTILPQDFQVSTNSAVGFSTHIASDSVGNFVIVWDDSRNVKIPYGGTGSNGDIYGQRYDNKGIPIGSNFRISDDSTDTDISYAAQILPRVAMNKRGEFVVTWIDTRPKGTSADPTIPLEFNIYAQRFDLTGKPVGTNFLVNDTPTSGQLDPDVVVRDDGSFVIIWVNTLDHKNIYLQAFDRNGNKIQSNQKLNLSGQQPRIALFENGDFIVAAGGVAQIFSWQSKKNGQPFSLSMGITREIKVSKNYKIFISYTEDRIVSGQFIDSDIFLQIYDTLGHPLTNKIKVNDDLTDYWQIKPALSVDNEHVFVAWQDYRNGYQIGDGECMDIYGQRFDLNLLRIGPNFKVSHEGNESGQIFPTTALRNDTIYTAWFDARKMEFYNVHPPIPKLDVWATIQNFNNPIEGDPIYCKPPSTEPPSSFNLFQSFPNPTQVASTFIYDLPEDANVKLSLYNILGKEVKTLITKFHTAGRYSRSFTINALPSGIYFAKIVAETSTGSTMSAVVRIALIK